MKEIRLLSQETIDQIAAGEVVERPSSVVKELVENSVDAGANAITVEIRDGGISLIRVTDNGEGIDRSQVREAFVRHATSKIRDAKDLAGVRSLGFRGEALSSISAVGQVELITKRENEITGIRFTVNGGVSGSIEEIGAPQGSTFIVRNLFYNTPVRKKFLKSAVTEAGYISDMMEHLALSKPEISFKFIVNGQVRLHTSGNGSLKDVIYSIYGREIAAGLIETSYADDHITVKGVIGKPEISRGNRNFENYFVDGRYVRSRVVMKAIEDGYGNHLMQHRYPFTVLFIEMAEGSVDVNVHPTKQEVRFSDNPMVYDRICRAVREALAGKEMIPEVFPVTQKEERENRRREMQELMKLSAKAPEPFEQVRRDLFRQSTSPYAPRYDYRKEDNTSPTGSGRVSEVETPHSGRFTNEPAGRFAEPGPGCGEEETAPLTEDAEGTAREGTFKEGTDKEGTAREGTDKEGTDKEGTDKEGTDLTIRKTPHQENLFDEAFLSRENVKQHRLIGQVFGTYWIVEFKDKMYLIDQHAAHEKVIYERMVRKMQDKTMTSQQLAVPILISLSLPEEELLRRYRTLFEEVGFEIEHFGGREYAIRAVPDNLYGFTDAQLFTSMLDTLGDTGVAPDLNIVFEKLAGMACKAAIKGNHRYSVQEADALIGELLGLENPYQCPHGRPTIITMSKYEMERKFKRIAD